MTTAAELEAITKVIADQAPKLREAGVLELQVDGLRATFAPWDPPFDPEQQPATTDDGAGSDPLNDPMLYGRAPGSGVPGRRNRIYEDED